MPRSFHRFGGFLFRQLGSQGGPLVAAAAALAGVWLESPHVQAHDRAFCAHDLMPVTGSIDRACRWQAGLLGTVRRWRGLKAVGLRRLVHVPSGCNLFCDAGTCVSRERAVRARPLSLVHCAHWRRSMFASLPSPTGSASAAPMCLWWSRRVLWSVR